MGGSEFLIQKVTVEKLQMMPFIPLSTIDLFCLEH